MMSHFVTFLEKSPLTHFWSLLSLTLRGSQVTSSVSFSFMMLSLCYLTVSLLWSLPFLPSGLAIHCNETQYEWPIDEPTLCCNKCPPGYYYTSRSETICDTKCEPCLGERYTDTYNLATSCNICDVCRRANFEIASSCKTTHNTVCKCRAGHKCKDVSCTKCVPIPTTVKPTLPLTTTVKVGSTSTTSTTKKINNSLGGAVDTQWFLVIIVLLCAGIALVVVTKIKPFLHWIRSNQVYFLDHKPVTVPLRAMDDDMSKPVQEVCGKCDHCIDLCIKE